MSPSTFSIRAMVSFAPVLAADADPETSTPSRWAHVTDEQPQDVRDALARWMRARLDHPVTLVPPEDGPRGCLFCGIGEVTVMASRADRAWTLRRVNPHSLGGSMSPDRLVGYLCPVCQAAADKVGSIGLSAMEGSLRAHLGVRERSMLQATVPNLVGWGVLARQPNLRPWFHVENLAELATGLA